MEGRKYFHRPVRLLAACLVAACLFLPSSGAGQRRKKKGGRGKPATTQTPAATQQEATPRGADNKEAFGGEQSRKAAAGAARPKRVSASAAIRNRRPGRASKDYYYMTSGDYPDGNPPRGRIYGTIGVTVGRGRAATEAESKQADVALVKLENGKVLVFERASDDVPVEDGTQMQMLIEYLAYRDAAGTMQSDRIGYLYVINREQYPNGGYGPARLIFPTRRTYGGDSRVLPGKTVTLPVPNRVWTVSRSESGTTQAFETYLIIVSPVALKDLKGVKLQGSNLSEKSLPLDNKLVTRWLRLAGGRQWRGDLEGGAGQLLSKREQKASGDPGVNERSTGEDGDDLTKADPPPQTFFSKALKPGGTILVVVKVPFKDGAAAAPQP